MEPELSFSKESEIGIIGSGAMGSGIAQVAATAGHRVFVFDTKPEVLDKARANLIATLAKLVDKQKITQQQSDAISGNIQFVSDKTAFKNCSLIIEAIVENLEIKKAVFAELETIVSGNCVLASNTSSLSITSIASACKLPQRVIGIHFFNPAPLMPLVEIIPGIATNVMLAEQCKQLITSWKKNPVVCKDTPGFIVNRIARPYYGEAMRMYEEGIADIATIDWAMKTIGGFKMGPFELTDMIGHDVNYTVTETVWKEFYFDPRFKPSISQKRLVEAGFYGKKTGRGFYNYAEGSVQPIATEDQEKGKYIFNRIVCMLINEAYDALNLQVASKEDIDLAMTKGVNYPKGLLAWAEEIGLKNVLSTLQNLYEEYNEDRYRPNVLLKRTAL
ncbi:MAG: 3-hydroxyacyl-CoA dehydrogenase NAD-binding domain-containing protein [Bacteroidota bacterium]|nr:3-hydroxyacyl-CoA dehydrogenase NAD-binding domain-containing protein [Bacteroidota bacterium]